MQFKSKEIKSIVFLQFSEINLKSFYYKIKGQIPDIINCFSEYKDTKDYIPPKQFT